MYLASERWVWIPMYIFIIISIIRQYRIRSIYILITLIVVMLLSHYISASLIKPFIGRLRPSHNPIFTGQLHFDNGYKVGIYSFVSSHATNVFAFAFFLFFRRNKIFDWKIILVFIWASFVSYSRIYLGVQFPSDIIGGAILGFSIAFIMTFIYHYFSLKNREKELLIN